MTYAQRRWHRWTWTLLGPAVLAALILGVAFRRPLPVLRGAAATGAPATDTAASDLPADAAPTNRAEARP